MPRRMVVRVQVRRRLASQDLEDFDLGEQLRPDLLGRNLTRQLAEGTAKGPVRSKGADVPCRGRGHTASGDDEMEPER